MAGGSRPTECKIADSGFSSIVFSSLDLIYSSVKQKNVKDSLRKPMGWPSLETKKIIDEDN